MTPPGSLIPRSAGYISTRGFEPYVSGDTALGIFLRNVNTGTQTYSSMYLGDVDTEQLAILALVCKNNSNYGGSKSLLFGTLTEKPVVFVTNSTERVRLSPDSNGFKFPNTANPSTNANTLDDYEEFTFTPTISFDSPGDLTISYGSQVGHYTKAGNRVFFDIQINCVPTFATASGQLKLSGLPFTASGYSFIALGQFRNINKSGYQLGGYTDTGSTNIRVVGSSQTGGAQVNIEASDLTSGTQFVIYLNGHYKTDS